MGDIFPPELPERQAPSRVRPPPRPAEQGGLRATIWTREGGVEFATASQLPTGGKPVNCTSLLSTFKKKEKSCKSQALWVGKRPSPQPGPESRVGARRSCCECRHGGPSGQRPMQVGGLGKGSLGLAPPLITTLEALLLFWSWVCIPACDVDFWRLVVEHRRRSLGTELFGLGKLLLL